MPLALRYEPLERLPVPRPVDRISYLVEACRGKRVLDLGALDETAWQVKSGRGTWLHERIAEVATEVLGVDNSDLVPAHGLRSGPRSVIRRGDVTDLRSTLRQAGFSPEVIVGGELIEHLENPLAFLTGIRSTRELRGRRLILTTPNGTALHNVLVGLASRESTHRDHLCILSFKTLNTLCLRAGLPEWRIRTYYARFTEMKERTGTFGRIGVSAGETFINLGEWMFPLLSFGLILDADL
jgi:hypothetical protein